MIFKFNEFILESATKSTTRTKPKTFNEIQKIVDTLKTITEFKKKHTKDFNRAEYKSWTDELFKNHPNGGRTIFPTFDSIQKIVDTVKDRVEFKDKYRKEHNRAEYKSWTDELFKNHPNGGRQKRTSFDNLQKIVDTIETRKEFSKKYREEWQKAANNSLLDKLFKNHPNGSKPTYKTFDDIQKIVDTLETRKEFSKKYEEEYNRAVSKSWLDKLFKNHPNGGKPIYKTFDDLQKIVDTVKDRVEFKEKYLKEHRKAVKNKWLDELFKNHPNGGRPTYTTFDDIQKIVDTLKTRDEFMNKYIKEFRWAKHNSWLDELFSNHPKLGYLPVNEPIKNRYVVYAFEFEELNSVYIGLTMNIERFVYVHSNLIKNNSSSSLSIFCNKNNVELPKPKLLNRNIDSDEARKKFTHWIEMYKKNGWNQIRSYDAATFGSAIRLKSN